MTPAEDRRARALAHAVAVAVDGTKPERIVAAAAAFEAYLISGQQPEPVRTVPTVALVNFLLNVRDLEARTVGGSVSVYNPATTTVDVVPIAVARTAEDAGLAVESDHGRWSLTGRGREAADRGAV